MLSVEERGRLVVVLAGARNPANIGAAARAMQDFGFSALRIANDFGPPLEAARLEARSAVGAAHVLEAAERFDSLAEAIVDCGYVVGTTAIGGRGLTQAVMPLKDAVPSILNALQAHVRESGHGAPGVELEHASVAQQKVALVFGSEKTGLTNEQLSHCALLTTIPMFQPEGRHLSMNLGQSVAVCLYELTRAGFEGARELPVMHEAVATSADRERLVDLLLKVMHETGYVRRYPHNAHEELVRQLVMQMGRSHREAMTWMGVLRQVLRSERGEAKKDIE